MAPETVIYFVTFRLYDSLPATKLTLLRQERQLWLKLNPAPRSLAQLEEYNLRFNLRVQEWLVFVALMAMMFFCIFTLAQVPMDWIRDGVQALGNLLETHLPEGDFRNLLVNGIISGVGAVITFLPQILILFFFIGLLEADSWSTLLLAPNLWHTRAT